MLSPKTVDLMISNHIGDLEVSLRGPGYGFGLGFSVLLDAGKSKEPLSPGTFGWGGAYCTYFFVDPVEELIGVFMTQMSPYRHINVRGQFTVLASQAIIESNRPIGGYKPIGRHLRHDEDDLPMKKDTLFVIMSMSWPRRCLSSAGRA